MMKLPPTAHATAEVRVQVQTQSTRETQRTEPASQLRDLPRHPGGTRMTVSSSSSSKENAADHLQVSCPAACSYLGRRSNTPNVDDDDDVFLVALLEEEESEDPPLLEKVMVFGSQLRGWMHRHLLTPWRRVSMPGQPIFATAFALARALP